MSADPAVRPSRSGWVDGSASVDGPAEFDGVAEFDGADEFDGAVVDGAAGPGDAVTAAGGAEEVAVMIAPWCHPVRRAPATVPGPRRDAAHVHRKPQVRAARGG